MQAQITSRNILQKLTASDIQTQLLTKGQWKPFPTSPNAWKEKLSDTLIASFIKNGEIAMAKPFVGIPATVALEFKRTGNRTHYQDLSFARRNQLWDLILAESVEGKGRFLDAIINGIWSISEETFWGIPAHMYLQETGMELPNVAQPVVDLFAAETGVLFGWADYFLGNELDKVSPTTRKRIRIEVERRIFKPLLTAQYRYLGVTNPDAVLNNWAPWVMSNYICTTLLLEDDKAKRTENILRANTVIDHYINGLGDDGAADEGPAYWFAAGGAVFDCLNLLSDASNGKLSVYNHPFIQKMGSYIYKMHIGENRYVNVADSHNIIYADGLMIYRFGKAVGDEKMMAFGAWNAKRNATLQSDAHHFLKFRGLYNIFNLKEALAFNKPFVNENDVWLKTVGLMTARTKNGFFVAAHGGHNAESHNHNDVGDFMLYADGEPVIIDVGAGTYTAKTFSKERYNLWFNTSPYHNLPTVNGFTQESGQQFKATMVSYLNTADKAELSLDMATTYATKSKLKIWKRRVTLHDKGTLVVTDNFSADKIDSLTQTFMTVCETNITKPGKVVFQIADGKQVLMTYDAKLWKVTKKEIELKTAEDQGLKSWGKPIWRLLLTYQSKSPKGKMSYSFSKAY